MVNFKVRTLDGRDHFFNDIDSQWTLARLREDLERLTTIEVDQQRLIFHGKVLRDEQKTLEELGIDGKVLHLAIRPPPAERRAAAARSLPPHPDHHHQHATVGGAPSAVRQPHRSIIVGTFPVRVQGNIDRAEIEAAVREAARRVRPLTQSVGINVSDANGADPNQLQISVHIRSLPQHPGTPAQERLEHIREILRHTRHIMFHLERDCLPRMQSLRANRDTLTNQQATAPTAGNNAEGNDSGGLAAESTAPEGSANAEDDVDRINLPLVGDCDVEAHEMPESERPMDESGELFDGGSSDHNYETPSTENANQQNPTPSIPQLASVFDEMTQLQTRLVPLQQHYRNFILQDERSYTDHGDEGRETARFFSSMQVVLHNVAHALHALSDLNIHFCQPPPRCLYPRYASSNNNNDHQDNHAAAQQQDGNGPEAAVTFQFISTGGARRRATATPRVTTATSQTTSSGQQPPPVMLSGAQQVMGPVGFVRPSANLPGIRPVVQQQQQQHVRIPIRVPVVTTSTTSVRMEIAPNGQLRVIPATQPNTAGSANSAIASGTAASSSNNGSGGIDITNTAIGNNTDETNAMQQMMQAIMSGLGQGLNVAAPVLTNAGGLAGFAGQMLTGQPLAAPAQNRTPATSTAQASSSAPTPQGRQPPQRLQATIPPQIRTAPQRRLTHLAGQSLSSGGAAGGEIDLDSLEEAINSGALFVGPRPPSQLPLYTLDPYLPCNSRHFDPRSVRERQGGRRRVDSGEQQQESATVDVASEGEQLASTPRPQQATSSSSEGGAAGGSAAGGGGLSFVSRDSSSIGQLEQTLRSVLATLGTNDTAQQQRRSQSQQQLYAFVPGVQQMAMPQQIVTGTVTVETRPNTGNAAAGQQNDGEGVDLFQNLIGGILQGGVNQNFASLLGGLPDANDTMSALLTALVQQLTPLDAIALMGGDMTRLDRLRPALRRHLIDTLMNDNSNPSPEDVAQAAGRLGTAPDIVARFLPADALRSSTTDGRTFDVVASILRCERRQYTRMLELTLSNGEEGTDGYGTGIVESLRQFVRQTVFILGIGRSAGEGQRLFEQYINDYLASSTNAAGQPQVPPALAQMVAGMTHGFIESTLQGQPPITEQQIEEDLVFIGEDTEEPSGGDAAQQEEVTTEQKQPSSIESEASASAEVFADARETITGDISKVSVVTAADGGGDEAARQTVTAEQDPDWIEAVPPEWATVIQQDIERQREMTTQAPFSDAYIEGMPPKRRKMMLTEKSNSQSEPSESRLRSLLSSSVDRAIVRPITGEQNTDVVNAAELEPVLVAAFEQELRGRIGERVASDPDFNAEQFPNAERVFGARNENKQ